MQSFVVKESLDSVKALRLEQEKLVEEIYKVLRRIGDDDKNIVKIILFGSLAEKRAVSRSTADILIILKRDDAPFRERIAKWSKKFLLDFPVEIFPYTEKELNNPIAQEAVKKGITLFERKENNLENKAKWMRNTSCLVRHPLLLK